MLTRIATAAVLATACGGAAAVEDAPPPCPSGDIRVVGDAELDAAASCTTVRGDLTIDGAALRNIDSLSSIERIEGSLVVGPTLRLTSVGGFKSLKLVTGDLDVRSNHQLMGVFFGALVEVGGSVNVDRNRSAATVSLHQLATVGGDLEISGNGALLRLDLGALQRVGGNLVVDDNRQLDDVVIGEVEVAGDRQIDLPVE